MSSKPRPTDEWMGIINTCRASGMSDKAWCEQNGINVNSFYTRVKRLRKQGYTVPGASFSGYSGVTSHDIVPVGVIDQTGELIPDVDTQPAIKTISDVQEHTAPKRAITDLCTQTKRPVIKLKIKGNEAQIPLGADDTTIRCVIYAMRAAC